jgi:hypothetical protein
VLAFQPDRQARRPVSIAPDLANCKGALAFRMSDDEASPISWTMRINPKPYCTYI